MRGDGRRGGGGSEFCFCSTCEGRADEILFCKSYFGPSSGLRTNQDADLGGRRLEPLLGEAGQSLLTVPPPPFATSG